jgi:hypothetical protein
MTMTKALLLRKILLSCLISVPGALCYAQRKTKDETIKNDNLLNKAILLGSESSNKGRDAGAGGMFPSLINVA